MVEIEALAGFWKNYPGLRRRVFVGQALSPVNSEQSSVVRNGSPCPGRPGQMRSGRGHGPRPLSHYARTLWQGNLPLIEAPLLRELRDLLRCSLTSLVAFSSGFPPPGCPPRSRWISYTTSDFVVKR